MTNAVVVAAVAGKHGVGAGNNTAATATRHSERVENVNGSAGGDVGGGDQLATNPLARLRSSDSFRYNFRVMNSCPLRHCFVVHNCPQGLGIVDCRIAYM